MDNKQGHQTSSVGTSDYQCTALGLSIFLSIFDARLKIDARARTTVRYRTSTVTVFIDETMTSRQARHGTVPVLYCRVRHSYEYELNLQYRTYSRKHCRIKPMILFCRLADRAGVNQSSVVNPDQTVSQHCRLEMTPHHLLREDPQRQFSSRYHAGAQDCNDCSMASDNISDYVYCAYIRAQISLPARASVTGFPRLVSQVA